MIRYAVELAELEARIDAALPARAVGGRGRPRKDGGKSWRDRARERTEQFRVAGIYNDPDGAEFWGELKDVFAQLQHNKCAYCETCLFNRKTGAVDGDIDHFRPKRAGDAFDAAVPTGGSHVGYHLLAYHAGNYVLTCRICNQDFKKAYFPVAGERVTVGDVPDDYASEEPFLLYPLGTTDTAPEEILQFSGVIADPVDDAATGSRNYWRARITIDLFDLNKRLDLRRQRAKVIERVFLALTATEDAVASRILANAIAGEADHANCARSFVRLFRADEPKARALADAAITLNIQKPAV